MEWFLHIHRPGEVKSTFADFKNVGMVTLAPGVGDKDVDAALTLDNRLGHRDVALGSCHVASNITDIVRADVGHSFFTGVFAQIRDKGFRTFCHK